ncbi:hypothetical protein D8674_005260 [Pyrus ussuriensis x Pyrus communis]|uniref:Uncharacterized protein n=1 Tax=Pyrus ussuriensis x Pyrus communis TaxID=2448454 RepID=A0A5N5FRD0_9ROSA|nr:hypothetical protein D8674_005260 [Pyrus ussuriensis x Pyrus communis]
MVRFMEKDNPNVRHLHDWYKYGEYGPYMWRGVVIGQSIRGRFTDKRVTMIRGVKDQDEWEKIEQFEMSQDFGKRSEQFDRSKGRKYFWVFVRHPGGGFRFVVAAVDFGVRAAEEELGEEKDEKYWDEEFEKAVSSSDADAMEKLAKQSVKATTEYCKKLLRTMEGNKNRKLEDREEGDGDETAMKGKRPTVSAEE